MRQFLTLLFLCGNNAIFMKSICDETHGCPEGMMCNFDQQTHGKCIRKSFFIVEHVREHFQSLDILVGYEVRLVKLL